MCGRIPDDLVRQLKSKLDQFDPAKLGDAKTTPIQKILTDFPNHQNDAVTMFDATENISLAKRLSTCMPNDINSS